MADSHSGLEMLQSVLTGDLEGNSRQVLWSWRNWNVSLMPLAKEVLGTIQTLSQGQSLQIIGCLPLYHIYSAKKKKKNN
jgi:hypothetical protein